MAAHQEPCELCQRLKLCREGAYPGLIAELDTGFAVMGESQFFPGYSVLIAKDLVTELHELSRSRRLRLLEEVAQLAEAVAIATQPHKLNYESLGNIVHHMHWHIFPRRLSDPDPKAPVWGQTPQGTTAEAYKFSLKTHGPLQNQIRTILARIRSAAT
jgi:diadenosine tetraphosphate (Ap4A) HIT family hydrolase